MRILFRLLPAGLILLVLAAAVLLFLPVFGKPLISLVQTEEISVSELLLGEIREICRFNTVEYHYKVVFPYDFDRPGVSEASIVDKLKRHFSGKVEDLLSPEEKLWLAAVNLAKAQGLNPYGPDWQFLVATINIKGGFDLQASPPSLAIQTRRESGRTIRTAVITLPPASVTRVEVEDPDRGHYGFPDIRLSPKGWRAIAGFIEEHAVSQSLREGLLAKARINAEKALRPLLIQAGYDEIEFAEPNP